MKVAITGGTGFVGKHLTQLFLQKKDTVILISRKKRRSDHPLIRHMTWDELESNIKPLEGVDAIVNLAGETINQRWTEEAKKRILESRLDAVNRVQALIEQLDKKPVLVNASGISIYGTSETESFIEESELRVEDFLSGVVDQWEMLAEHIPDTRVVLLRIGLVLGNDGGAFPKMSLPFKLGVGGRVGSGRQILSWIHIEDLCRMIEFCIEHEEIEGPVNGTAPIPVTNDQFGRSLAKALRRPYWFPVPAFVLKALFGELSEPLLKGQKVFPKVVTDLGFRYNYPVIDHALENLVRSGKKG
ncbi:TIGR01777 family oxidoreductase [Paenibacillus sp. MZ04-78.2]|uniref:TIGR01777 family oxidoreductase n=1 Tax=Paenibacillus sp. MZ04-78.2 TaxID=2962034 RepID=UPI0020B733C9|nr:TIGR01777 family oxidoreductase [Paenibacillus sp. MZ04-78.2]MCP3775641.1 TIGR01777 family oxidoreductase [Paenibacillus sp. MZ04-78.2]